MRAFALTCEALAHLESVEGKVQCAASHLASRSGRELAVAARFLSGTPLPPGTTSPRVGGATIAGLVAERCGLTPESVRRRAVAKGDLGSAVAQLLERLDDGGGEPLQLTEIVDALQRLGTYSLSTRLRRLRELFDRAAPLEAKYLTKLLVGSLRTGMQAGRVEEAIALAFRRPVAQVRRAHMLLGDIGAAATRARADTLAGVRLRAFRPVRSMLAHAAEDAADVAAHLSTPLIAEPKFDGVRAQLHTNGSRHRLYSRSLDDFTHLFPEIGDGTKGLSEEWILDGEIVAWSDGPLCFAELQQRLGRQQVPLTILLDVPVVYLAFDVLRAAGRDLIDEPLAARKRLLARLPEDGPVRTTPFEVLDDAGDIARPYAEAIDAGYEGVIYKDPDSSYRPGTRGRSWLKLKPPLGTLDVVVTAAQYGRGKRAGWLSDLTFAVRGDDGLLDVGKAYSGLTDAEIRALTGRLKQKTIGRSGDRHHVEPEIVLQVAFGGVQRSRRHPSGFALRFPRIMRLRDELGPLDIDTLEHLEGLYRDQKSRPHEP